jgi:hypothetical protein
MFKFKVILVGPDGYRDEKFFSSGSDALKYAKSDGLEAFEGEVETASVYSPEGELIWHRTRAKLEDQEDKGSTAQWKAGIYGWKDGERSFQDGKRTITIKRKP